jgi:hypothetical protein
MRSSIGNLENISPTSRLEENLKNNNAMKYEYKEKPPIQ